MQARRRQITLCSIGEHLTTLLCCLLLPITSYHHREMRNTRSPSPACSILRLKVSRLGLSCAKNSISRHELYIVSSAVSNFHQYNRSLYINRSDVSTITSVLTLIVSLGTPISISASSPSAPPSPILIPVEISTPCPSGRKSSFSSR